MMMMMMNLLVAVVQRRVENEVRIRDGPVSTDVILWTHVGLLQTLTDPLLLLVHRRSCSSHT